MVVTPIATLSRDHSAITGSPGYFFTHHKVTKVFECFKTVTIVTQIVAAPMGLAVLIAPYNIHCRVKYQFSDAV